ncbi:MAG: pseudouridine synthase, partial [Kofleriaceae bacterium]
MSEPVRLQRYLASAGVAARRKAEDLITAGRVKVNGKVVTVLGTKINPDADQILVDDQAVVALDKFYVLFNKPKGCITAVTDDRGRPTVMDYLPNLPVPVKPVGRLDFYSEGVLLLTNDGELAARLLAPASHVPKTYHVKVHGQLAPADLKALRDGITLDDGATTLPAEVERLPGESKHTWLAITIHEGKHRQIHRMIEALGYSVDKLQRVAFANLTFHNLRIGDARELTQLELNQLRDAVGLDHSAVARGKWRSDRETTDIPRRARAKAREEAEAARAEMEANRAANEARRAARGDAWDGDAWDGEGDPDRPGLALEDRDTGAIHHTGLGMEDRDAAGEDEPDTIHHTGLGMEDRDAAGRGGGRAPRGNRSDTIHHTGLGMEDRDAAGARSRGSRGRDDSGRRDARGGSRGGGARVGVGTRNERGGSRGVGARDERGGPRGGGSRGGFGARDDRGGSRGDGPRGGGSRGGFGARDDRGGSRGDGPRGGGPRGGTGPRGGFGARDERGGSRGDGPRGGGPRGGTGPRGGFGARDERGGSRGDGPRGTAARGGGGFGARDDQGGSRGGGPRGTAARGGGPRSGTGPR